MKRARATTLVAIALITAAPPAAWSLGSRVPSLDTGEAAGPTPTPGACAAQGPAVFPGAPTSYRDIVQRAGPAVVGVMATGQYTVTPDGAPDDAPNDLDDHPRQLLQGAPSLRPHVSSLAWGISVPFRNQGTGFIVSADGLIVTASHIVRDARDVTVRLRDRREFEAKLVGTDPVTDIAVLRIDAAHLPVIRLGDAQQLQVGDPVLAIGSPFGLEQSATQGIVSGMDRSLPGEPAVPYIQTDAAMNPGSSGGPLFDACGAVVGISAQIYSRTGGFQGLSFAIPIKVAQKVVREIATRGRAAHALLGVSVQDVTQGLAESFGLRQPSGALVTRVSPGSAAAAAGLRPGDVIVDVDDLAIDRAGELGSRISEESPGRTVRLRFWRDAGLWAVTARLGAVEDEATHTVKPDEGRAAGPAGLDLRTLTDQEKARLGLRAGLLVVGVSGAAASAGVRPGDALLGVNGELAESVDAVHRMLSAGRRRIALLILHDGEQFFVVVTLR